LRKVARNYTMDYVRTALPVLAETFGVAEARHLGGITGRLIGMQYYAETAALLGVPPGGAEGFARYLCALGQAQDDAIDWQRADGEVIVRQRGWRLMRGVSPLAPSVFEGWNALWEGALSIHDRHLTLAVTRRPEQGTEGCIEWRLRDGG
jgi:hypothetical protein